MATKDLGSLTLWTVSAVRSRVIFYDLRMELGTECLEHFLPVLMKSETAAWREANHVAGVKLPFFMLAISISIWINYQNLHIQWGEGMTTR